MSYMNNLDLEVKETLEQIYDEMYVIVPEHCVPDKEVEARIAELVHSLVNTVLKGGSDGVSEV